MNSGEDIGYTCVECDGKSRERIMHSRDHTGPPIQFSVVLTTFNRAELVGRAITSILNQSCGDFELIVVDDGSTDRTPQVLAEYVKENPRIRILRLENNTGLAGARNRGIAEGKGGFVAFMDDDDEAMPEWLEKSREKILDLPDTWGVVYPRYLIREELTGITYPNVVKPKEGHIFENLVRGEHLPFGCPGAVIRRRALEKSGGFDEEMSGVEDYDLWYTLSKFWTFHFINAPLILVHEHSSGRMTDEGGRREDVYRKFNAKWREDIIRIGGEEALASRDLKDKAGSFFARIRRITHREGRLSAARMLVKSTSRKNFKMIYFLKDLFIIFVGPRIYDRARKVRGRLYWLLYKAGRKS